MSNKLFFGVITLFAVGFIGFFVFNPGEPSKPRPGVSHSDNGQQHVQAVEYGGEEPPTSGDHTTPLAWQVYDQEIPDGNAIHNMEHGGVYISYRPDLPKEQVDKIKALFSTPYSKPEFKPSKAIVAPRSANKAPIVLSSWTQSQTFESFDEIKIIEYYKANIGKSPEPTAS